MIYRLEACVEDSVAAVKAIRAGAHQVELCRDLQFDGLTPSPTEVIQCLKSIAAPVKVMIRPKPGSFVCDQKTLDLMIEEAKNMRSIDVQYFVFGMTTSDRQLDLESIAQLIQEVYPHHVTIHKAIDTCLDPVLETRRLVELGGVSQILTSGGAKTAWEGAAVIRSMIEAAQGQIEIIAAGSITQKNLNKHVELIQAPVYHGRKIVGSLS